MKIRSFIQSSPIAGLMATQLSLSRYLEKNLARTGLNYLEALVLTSLFFEEKHKLVSPSQIARNVLYPLPRVSATLSKLHEKELISREFVKEDCRKTSLVLTSRGYKQAQLIIGIFNSIQESIETTLSENQSLQINRSLLRLRTEVFK